MWLALLQQINLAYRSVSTYLNIQDYVDEIIYEEIAHKKTLDYLSRTHPDFERLRSGEVSSLSFHVFAYKEVITDASGRPAMGDLNPVSRHKVFTRYVGAGTSPDSAVYLRLLEESDFFDEGRILDEIRLEGGIVSDVGNAVLIEVSWNFEKEGFDEFQVIKDTSSIVRRAERKVGLANQMSGATSISGYVNLMTRIQRDNESAALAVAELKDKARLDEMIARKNATLSRIREAVEEYELHRSAMAREQGRQMVNFLLSAASIITSEYQSSVAKLKSDEMHKKWDGMMDRISKIERDLGTLDRQLGAVEEVMRQLKIAVHESYRINFMNYIDRLARREIFPPPPRDDKPRVRLP